MLFLDKVILEELRCGGDTVDVIANRIAARVRDALFRIPCLQRTALTLTYLPRQISERLAASAIGYGVLHATIASGRVRLATDGGAKIAR